MWLRLLVAFFAYASCFAASSQTSIAPEALGSSSFLNLLKTEDLISLFEFYTTDDLEILQKFPLSKHPAQPASYLVKKRIGDFEFHQERLTSESSANYRNQNDFDGAKAVIEALKRINSKQSIQFLRLISSPDYWKNREIRNRIFLRAPEIFAANREKDLQAMSWLMFWASDYIAMPRKSAVNLTDETEDLLSLQSSLLDLRSSLTMLRLRNPDLTFDQLKEGIALGRTETVMSKLRSFWSSKAETKALIEKARGEFLSIRKAYFKYHRWSAPEELPITSNQKSLSTLQLFGKLFESLSQPQFDPLELLGQMQFTPESHTGQLNEILLVKIQKLKALKCVDLMTNFSRGYQTPR